MNRLTTDGLYVVIWRRGSRRSSKEM